MNIYDQTVEALGLPTEVDEEFYYWGARRAFRIARDLTFWKAWDAPRPDMSLDEYLEWRASEVDSADEDDASGTDDRWTGAEAVAEFWENGVAVVGTPAEAYLKARGLGAIPSEIGRYVARYRSRKGSRAQPALVFPIRKIQSGGAIIGIHAVCLVADADGSTKRSAKLTNGKMEDGVIMIPGVGSGIIVCEGPEDAIALNEVTHKTCWAVMSKSRLDRLDYSGWGSILFFLDSDASEIGDGLVGEYEDARWAVAGGKAKDANERLIVDGADALLGDVESALGGGASEFDNRWVYLAVPNAFSWITSTEKVSAESFNNIHPQKYKDPNGSKRKISAAKYFVQRYADTRVYFGETYKPGADAVVMRHGQKYINLWRPSSIGEGKEGDCTLWFELLEALVEDETERMWLVMRMAMDLQRPDVKCNWHMLMHGPQGAGKDSLLEPFMRGVGSHNVSIVPQFELESSFNDYLVGGKVLLFPEIESRGQKKLYSKLKEVMAAPPHELTVNPKGFRRYTVPNIFSCWFYSNDTEALSVDEDDRRLFVVHVQKAAGVDFEQLHDAYDNGLCEAVVWWLHNCVDLNINEFKGSAPRTVAKKELIERSMGRNEECQLEIREILEGEDVFQTRDLWTIKDLKDRVGHFLSDELRGVYKRSNLITAMQQLGAVAVYNGNPVILSNGKQVRLWALRNPEKYAPMSGQQLKNAFEEA